MLPEIENGAKVICYNKVNYINLFWILLRTLNILLKEILSFIKLLAFMEQMKKNVLINSSIDLILRIPLPQWVQNRCFEGLVLKWLFLLVYSRNMVFSCLAKIFECEQSFGNNFQWWLLNFIELFVNNTLNVHELFRMIF